LGGQDIPYYADGVPAKSNAQLIKRIVRIETELGREIATPEDTRKILGLPPALRKQKQAFSGVKFRSL
jgi:3-keto-5-aminohexanoate cleavage enzyme